MTMIAFAFAALLGGTPAARPAALLQGCAAPPESRGSIQSGLPRVPTALEDFDCRLRAYMEIHRAAAIAAPPMRVTANMDDVRQAMDALALSIRQRRPGARPGDIFTPPIAVLIRELVRQGCGGSFTTLHALVTEELEAPLPAPVVHGGWPEGTPLPTMPPDLLAALPRLPAGLEYRFLNRDLVLLDIDANLIVDFVRDAIPPITTP